jgi:hypothetical protein
MFIEFAILVTLVREMKVCSSEHYNKVHIANYLFDSFPIQNSLKQDVLLPLRFKFSLEYAIMEVYNYREIGIKWE